MVNNYDVSPCMKCMKMTKSIRKGRAHYECEICGHNKTLSDVYYYEMKFPEGKR